MDIPEFGKLLSVYIVLIVTDIPMNKYKSKNMLEELKQSFSNNGNSKIIKYENAVNILLLYFMHHITPLRIHCDGI